MMFKLITRRKLIQVISKLIKHETKNGHSFPYCPMHQNSGSQNLKNFCKQKQRNTRTFTHVPLS